MRQFLVIAAIAIGLACPACNDPLPKEKEPPQTTAGKLIGKWKLVRFSNGQPTSPELDHDNLVFADPYSNPDHGVEYKRIEVGEHK